ncbi:MAG TPA: IPT/TIG domain-containing protein [Terriglobales bacterium]|nr:IPT/TIG domain-containing protein [Terriglobales bacterium]
MKLLSLLLLMMLSLGCGGYSSGSGMRPASTPSISTLSPDSANAGGSDFVLTVNGMGFASNSVVYWKSASIATTYVSAQQLTAQISMADIATAGAASVYVNNPGTGMYASGVNSNTANFTVN